MSTRLTRDELVTEIRNSLTWSAPLSPRQRLQGFQSESGTNKDVTSMFPPTPELALLLAEMNERADALSTIVLHASRRRAIRPSATLASTSPPRATRPSGVHRGRLPEDAEGAEQRHLDGCRQGRGRSQP